MEAKDFAKLFRIDGIGQILACLEEDDNGEPCVRFRIPDHASIGLEMRSSPQGDSYEQREEFAIAIFNALDENTIKKAVLPLISARTAILGHE